MTHNTGSASAETLLKLLASERRRLIIGYLAESGEPTAQLATLVEEAASAESAPAGQIETDLIHVQLPELAMANLIEYDRRSGTIRYRGNERVETLLECIRTLPE